MSGACFPNLVAGAQYPWHSFKLPHELQRHALLTQESLVAVAAGLPAEQVEYNLGELEIGQSAKTAPRNGLSARETVERIGECNSWMVMKNVEILPEYRLLMDQCLDELWGKLPPLLTGLHLRESFIFISSPHSVTPFHIDPEHNFLLQIRGRKQLRIWPPGNRTVLPDTVIERTVGGGEVTRSIPYREEYAGHAAAVELTPGEGVYIPFQAPHWVKNGGEISISYSITYRSTFSRRKTTVHAVNKRLRSIGITPSEVGRHPWLDAMKFGAAQGFRSMRSLIS